MFASAQRHLGDLCDWHLPDGGMFFWIKVRGVEDTWDMIIDRFGSRICKMGFCHNPFVQGLVQERAADARSRLQSRGQEQPLPQGLLLARVPTTGGRGLPEAGADNQRGNWRIKVLKNYELYENTYTLKPFVCCHVLFHMREQLVYYSYSI